ncbi:hypothetical protein M9Y10_036832 [Tritrichomonas musculus]|uniref:alpha-L-rhamnosidase n=1 Tax=Tritrichomonas musculus TaxID=1915356 RepID=A0ABR2GTY4_9EUKA
MASKIVKMRLNGIENPIGYDTSSLSFSWIVEGTESKFQKTARVIISMSPMCNPDGKQQLIHDSGDQPDIKSIDYCPNLDVNLVLRPRTRYYWQVHITTDSNETIYSPVSYFETSKLSESWDSKWISTENVGNDISPYLRKTFEIPSSKNVKEARVYCSGLGFYELYINGAKVSDEFFLPSNNNYDLWLQYQTFDVTHFLRPNINTIGALLGDGWARGRNIFFGNSADFNARTRGNGLDLVTNRFEFLFEMHLLYDDGSCEVVKSDNSWKCHKSHIVVNSIYDGELQDGNLLIKDWNLNECDEKNWVQCNEIEQRLHSKLVPRFSPPVRIMSFIKPKEIIRSPLDETIIDMGQNFAGWIRMKIRAPKDFNTIVEYGEVLNGGNFYRMNLGNALQRFQYVSSGDEEVEVQPHFTYFGFRYARLSNWSGSVNIDDFIGCVVYSDLEEVGEIKTGKPIVNQLISNCIWSQRSNFIDVPTDCPQRPERLGWTGDAQIFCKTAMFNMNCYSFYRKFLKDLYLHQLKDNGIPPIWCPQLYDLSVIKENFSTDGTVAWSDAATIMPWNAYVMNGKKQILEDQYDGMKKWVDVMSTHVHEGIWVYNYQQFGDWLALDGPKTFNDKPGTIGGTELTFICTTYYLYSLRLTAKAAKVLGKNDDFTKYNDVGEKTLKAIRDEYFTPNGRCAIQTQTALSLAIIHDLYPEGKINVSVASLYKLLKNNDFHISTGFIGTQILCKALTKGSCFCDAMNTFMKKDYPGWLYPITKGATTIWERWNGIKPDGEILVGMNSFNHYAY